ncbi:MAG TPA: hypothetical protein GXX17_07675 [Clostridiales bacterium]|nr:hypothetical protein [Clostridiales bacterium]
MRITAGMIARHYSKNLNRSLRRLNDASIRAINRRKFSKVSEDPLAAIKAFRIRNEYDENLIHISNAQDIQSVMVAAESSLMTINSMIQEANFDDLVKGLNGTMQETDRSAIASKLRKIQEAVVTTMNTKFGDQYLFGGATKNEPPFSVENGQLYYRNINVNTGLYKEVPAKEAVANIRGMRVHFGVENGAALNGYTLNVQLDETLSGSGYAVLNDTNKTITVYLGGNATNAQLQDALQNMANAPASVDLSKITVDNPASLVCFGKTYIDGGSYGIAEGTPGDLTLLANEAAYIDIGLGLKFNGQEILDNTVYNSAFPGIDFIGYGTTENGIPKNFYTLLGEIASRLESANFDAEGTKPYVQELEKQYNEFLTKLTGFGAKSNFIENTIKRLEDLDYNLIEKSDAVEFVDPTTAIMEYKLMEYSYNAALQMGVNLLQPTLLDYLR